MLINPVANRRKHGQETQQKAKSVPPRVFRRQGLGKIGGNRGKSRKIGSREKRIKNLSPSPWKTCPFPCKGGSLFLFFRLGRGIPTKFTPFFSCLSSIFYLFLLFFVWSFFIIHFSFVPFFLDCGVNWLFFISFLPLSDLR